MCIVLKVKEDKKMKIKAFKDLLTSVDVLNTVNGGVSEPFISLREKAVAREIRVRVPGITKEALQVEINNNEISVYYLIPIQTSGKVLYMPQILLKQTIPYFIEVTEIKASYDDNELVVKLPFNKLKDGYNRQIEIGEE